MAPMQNISFLNVENNLETEQFHFASRNYKHQIIFSGVLKSITIRQSYFALRNYTPNYIQWCSAINNNH